MAFSEKGERLGLSARNAAAVTGVLNGPGVLRYSLGVAFDSKNDRAIELEYEASPKRGLDVWFAVGERSKWSLPLDASFLGIDSAPRTIRYRVPVGGDGPVSFTVEARAANGKKADASEDSGVAFVLKSVSIVPRAYGFVIGDGVVFLSPYVAATTEKGITRYSIEPPLKELPAAPLGITLIPVSAKSQLEVGDSAFVCYAQEGVAHAATLTIPSGALPEELSSAAYSARLAPRGFLLQQYRLAGFPETPIAADPGIVLAYRQESWRDPRYEVFKWERFPSVLVFDTANYATQDKLFKRLAFFVEKAGFRGKLATDADMSALHGWNAHDYRAEDLAVFFETARSTKFRLNAEERELEDILIQSGIIRRAPASGAISSGIGAVISISRESTDYLRTLFITHEAWHGIFFIDEDFRRFAQVRYDSLDAESRRFLHAYFDSHRYDVRDPYLMKNELMAYCLQQRLSLVAKYFGDNLPTRLEKDPVRSKELPVREKDAALPYPTLAAAFLREAEGFDAYAAERWGLQAGRVASIYQISRTAAAR